MVLVSRVGLSLGPIGCPMASEVRIGTTVSRIGNSSVTFSQALFVDDNCVATAQAVLVLIDNATRKSRPLPD
jgi:acyl-CoA thioester hydrolase